MSTYYEILEIPRNASQNDVKEAYRKLSKKYHPDLNPDDVLALEKTKKLNEAYAVLGVNRARWDYDAILDGGKYPPVQKEPSKPSQQTQQSPPKTNNQQTYSKQHTYQEAYTEKPRQTYQKEKLRKQTNTFYANAANYRTTARKKENVKYGIIAACVGMVITLVVLLFSYYKPQEKVQEFFSKGDGKPVNIGGGVMPMSENKYGVTDDSVLELHKRLTTPPTPEEDRRQMQKWADGWGMGLSP